MATDLRTADGKNKILKLLEKKSFWTRVAFYTRLVCELVIAASSILILLRVFGIIY